LTTAAPASGPSRNQCNPEQGQRNSIDYDMAGRYTFSQCTFGFVQFTSGVFKIRSAFNLVDNGSTRTSCGKHHDHTVGAKAVDSQGNLYNVMQVNRQNWVGTFSTTSPEEDSVARYSFKAKFVGHGQLENTVVTFSYACRITYDAANGLQEECKKNEWEFKC